VKDFLISLCDVYDGGVSEATAIGRLAAAFGIEDRVSEDRERLSTILTDLDDIGLELSQVTVAVVGGFNH
jgi:hypothetical protein